ncbi:Asp-tRNA(Asn)/Glu-tRNA(Gln) amidotransferase GatCAB subunit C [Candidatus Peregrinibacteria bacterium CG10_big_fil_rev_8_21_14_0_10_36_19]|nr:MAG: Asp-tRNA(Asn)/Glu-tRNA(Gln) amidotransferase GatCAB subunit C [Candidatus Peregrinibacteria bacterium CG10_big_fil_rev_8_21_14_0_10_36_19]
MLNDEQVRHVAKLARLKLSDEDVTKFGGQLNKVLGYMDILKEVDVDGVEITNQVTGLNNAMRGDVVESGTATPADILACSELDKESDQIKVMKTI